eukprot:Protomagalhaensia_wolfi_Nauph_80__1512@NODE_1919_length_1278_cov_270_514931_g348_i1_p1_GENE_NODE_1919_length_1278_cov_270_514931_g348_i1NODE_1919_length_1278_cov_270_514931_g348_i1_p1_ORF_typecomplete_len261_score29_50_NODE_1919_length_1278_cov_270_514931_g348_i13611143
MHFQVRLPCIDVGVCKSEDCSQYPFSTGQYVPSDNQCGSEIPAIAGLPGANECCCPKAQLHLLKSTQALARNSKQLELDGIWSHLLGVASNTPTDGEADSSLSASSSTPALDSTQCTQNRKCQFLCCSSQSKFCGSQCCQSDELCGQRVVDQRPCCVAPFPRIIPSPNAPPNLNISLHRLAQVGREHLCSLSIERFLSRDQHIVILPLVDHGSSSLRILVVLLVLVSTVVREPPVVWILELKGACCPSFAQVPGGVFTKR